MKRIIIMPIGKVDTEILRSVSSVLENKLHAKSEAGRQMSIPPAAYNAKRAQYKAVALIKEMIVSRKRESDILLGIIDADLYVSSLNYVFGEADPYAGVAVISLWRLRQEFYGIPRDRNLLKNRSAKEVVHEIGHVYGLDHCPHPECIMYFSNNISDTDRKGPGFCDTCKNTLGI